MSINHEYKWELADQRSVFGDVAETPLHMSWYQKSPLGESVGRGSSNFENMTRLDGFLLSFRPSSSS